MTNMTLKQARWVVRNMGKPGIVGLTTELKQAALALIKRHDNGNNDN